MGATDVLGLSVREADGAIDAGALAPRELFDAYRQRAAADIVAGSEGLNCFTWVAAEAPAGDAHAPLGGVPVAVKDLFCTEGVPSQAGSRILEGYLPPYTASAVSRLQGAGATLMAKTN